jgi:endoglucanase
MLVRSWAEYKSRFINSGRVIDLGGGRVTTSEGQAYAMLRAVYLDDRATFDDVWNWTRTHLQVRGDGLLAWRWGPAPEGGERVLDQGAATDADQDAALALLFASRRWHNAEYQRQAVTILQSMWERETAVIGGRRILVAGEWARGEDGDAVVNPSYWAPYAYRIFAEADPDRRWMDLVDSSYAVLTAIQSTPALGGQAGMVPNWVALDRKTGRPKPAAQFEAYGREFSYDASRLPWRLALDLVWFEDPRAKRALNQISLPQRELSQSGRLLAAYRPDGTPAADYESLSMYAGAIPSLLFRGDDDLALRQFADKVLRRYGDSPYGTAWGDRDNYYDQNWAWFATAFMDGGMANLWAGQTVVEWRPILARVAEMPSPGSVPAVAAGR